MSQWLPELPALTAEATERICFALTSYAPLLRKSVPRTAAPSNLRADKTGACNLKPQNGTLDMVLYVGIPLICFVRHNVVFILWPQGRIETSARIWYLQATSFQSGTLC